MIRKSVFALLLWAYPVLAQSAAAVGSGFTTPTPMPAAPGELIEIYVTGIGQSLTQPVTANSLPLPYSLAGISVNMAQSRTNEVAPVPLVSVFPLSSCISFQAQGCSQYTGIILQIPYELISGGPSLPPNIARLTIEESGTTAVVEISPFSDRIHVLRAGEMTPRSPGIQAQLLNPVITHADGTSVDGSHPARPGETVVVYAVGLGQTTPPAVTGAKAQSAMVVEPVRAGFTYLSDPTAPSPPMSAPVFSGLTSGFVGLYQMNLVVPPAPSSLEPCLQSTGATFNLILTMVAPNSADSVGICVQP